VRTIYFNLIKRAACIIAVVYSNVSVAQLNLNPNNLNLGEVHGNFEANAQYYIPDSTIGAAPVPEKMRISFTPKESSLLVFVMKVI
jgi:hypothetical protein